MATSATSSNGNGFHTLWGLTRIALGLIFLWAFFDKLFGLTYTTAEASSWLNGGHPTQGYLSSSYGPLADMFHGMAGNGIVDFLFMAGLLLIGVGLTLGIANKLSCWSGALMMLMMYASHPIALADAYDQPHGSHPFMDDHIVYALVLMAMAAGNAGRYLGLSAKWQRMALVRKNDFLA